MKKLKTAITFLLSITIMVSMFGMSTAVASAATRPTDALQVGSIQLVSTTPQTPYTLKTINGRVYLCAANGVYLTGWQTFDGAVRYFDPAQGGAAPQGFTKLSNGYTYYFWYTGGGTFATGLQTISEKAYYFDSGGHLLTGWQTVSGAVRYFDPAQGGAAPQGWFKHNNGYTYYFWYAEQGSFATGLQTISEKAYCFDSEGHLLTGWQTVGGAVRYFDPAQGGAAPKGWVKLSNGYTYYFWYAGQGTFATGLATIGSVQYVFDSQGHFVTPYVRSRDDYSFTNTDSSFGYPANYRIPLQRYTDLLGPISGELYYDSSGKWTGSCFGFAASDADFFIGGLSPSTYSSGANNVYSIPTPGSPSSKTTQMIETYQISQLLPDMIKAEDSHKNDYTGLINALQPGNLVENGIVALSISNKSGDGHAVVCYAITDNPANSAEYMISYYNNWYVGRIDYLYINKNNHSLRFSDSDMENMFGTAHGLTGFYFVTSAEVRLAMLSSSPYSSKLYGNLVTVTKDTIIYDASNNPVPESYVIPLVPGNAASNQVLYSLPAGKYSIKTNDSSSAAGKPFVVGVSDDSNYIRLSSDSGNFDVTFELGAAPNLLLSNVDSVIDGQIISTNASLSTDSLNVENVSPGTYVLSFFGSTLSPNPDNIKIAPLSTDDNGTKQMGFTIDAK